MEDDRDVLGFFSIVESLYNDLINGALLFWLHFIYLYRTDLNFFEITNNYSCKVDKIS